ncbi:CoA ester lyase [Brucella endophytica]|uniref:CoA ester lyase n=1 Tax=Brucella endophytica TaxID=1963359 RepID=A0A916S5U7_9HYPH|nr:aldolase/citrate lyase family protein [Brucella endophytica]GGA85014.1 CoA ester lyase [Brucella endophytica]
MMRSLLLVRDGSEAAIEKALLSGADALVLDLAMAATAGVTGLLQDAAKDGLPLYGRIDMAKADDLTGIFPITPRGVFLPQSNGPADIVRLSARLNVYEAEAGLDEGSMQIIAIAAANAVGALSMDYRDSTPRLTGLGWDAGSLAGAIGPRTAQDENGDYIEPLRLARALTILGAKAAGVMAIDTAYANLNDEAGLGRECAAAARDGFTAKIALHPAQVPAINAAFTR